MEMFKSSPGTIAGMTKDASGTPSVA